MANWVDFDEVLSIGPHLDSRCGCSDLEIELDFDRQRRFYFDILFSGLELRRRDREMIWIERQIVELELPLAIGYAVPPISRDRIPDLDSGARDCRAGWIED